MSDPTQLTTHELWVDGRKISLSLQKIDPTTVRVSWTLPSPIQVYNGAVVLLSEEQFTSGEFPVDGTRYTASSNWAAPADTIGKGQVVAAFYGFFGDDITQTFVDISNVDPNKLYFASIHAASNVLQYYTIGTQSYPLESSRFEKNSETFAGSIPKTSTPPQNPHDGQVYFDPSVNRAFVWNAAVAAWLEPSSKTVLTGERPYISNRQVFFDSTASALKTFIGGSWIECNAVNTRIKFGAGWVPLGSTSVVGTAPTAPTPGDVILLTIRPPMAGPGTSEVRVFTLGQWLLLTGDLIQFETAPAVWENLIIGDPLFGSSLPSIPGIGEFFYDSSKRDLLVWTGTAWEKADTENEGTPSTDKIGVGTDGSYDERLRLMKVLKSEMGWPQVCVELTEDQFNVAIDNALEEFRRRADNAYSHRYVLFTIKQGQNTYYLNDPRNDTDKIVTIIKIHRINLLGVSALSTDSNIYAQAFFQQYYQGSMVDLVSIHLMHQLSESFERIFAGNLAFTWDEASRQMTILRRLTHAEERVILEVSMERTEQELLLDRWAKQWIQAWAEAELKKMLGNIRSKYGNLPGPNGGITLNGDMLLSEARMDFEELLRQIQDYEVGNGGVNFGNCAFLIG